VLKTRVTSSTEFGLLWARQSTETTCATKLAMSAAKSKSASNLVALALCSSCEKTGPPEERLGSRLLRLRLDHQLPGARSFSACRRFPSRQKRKDYLALPTVLLDKNSSMLIPVCSSVHCRRRKDWRMTSARLAAPVAPSVHPTRQCFIRKINCNRVLAIWIHFSVYDGLPRSRNGTVVESSQSGSNARQSHQAPRRLLYQPQ